MKKKVFGIFLVLILIPVFFAGCFGRVKKGNNSDKIQIVISIYNGGHGTDWIQPAIDEFERDYPDYEISLEKRKRTVEEIANLISIGKQAHAYISPVADFHKEIYSDKLADLSDILQMKVDGTDKTIGDKLLNEEHWRKVSSKDGQGVYMLPFDESFLGFNYDHQKFIEYGLMHEAENTDAVKNSLADQGIEYSLLGNKLKFVSSDGATNYNPGDTILRAGKDGKYGTYDDGQPITIAEWNYMFNLLKGLGKAVIYSGKIVDYTTDIFNAVFAQYDGLDGWETYTSYNGNYTFEGGAGATDITLQTGYKVFGMTGIKKATEFLQTYLNDREYVHESAFMSEESHTDAQGKFLIGTARTSAESPFSGMLVDGVWWENEARGIFSDLSSGTRPDENFKYGVRDYRIMMLPEIPGQKGVDGEGKGSVLSVRSAGAYIVPKNENTDLVEKAKIFLAYTLKDKNLSYFTALTGSPRPYDYELTAEDMAAMSKFALNNWNIYNDTENIGLVRPLLDRYVTAVPYKTSKGYNVNWMSKVGAVSYNMPINALRTAESSLDASINSDPVKTVFEGFYKHFEAAWPTFMNELNS